MKWIKVGAASLNQTPLDWVGNTNRILDAIETARVKRVSILCLPELCLTGYGCEDLFHAPHVIERAWDILREKIAPATSRMIVAVGLPIMYQNSHYNAAALLVDGRVVGFTVKQFLAGDGIHYEPRWFKAWPAGVVTDFDLDGVIYPLGDLHYRVGGVSIGFEICEDAWVAQRPGSNLAFQGVDIILNPSASHFSRGKFQTRKNFVEEGSRAFGVTYVYTNLVGNEAGTVIFDGGCLIAYDGSIIAAENRFSFNKINVITGVVDVEYSRANRNQISSYRPVVDSIQTDCVNVPFQFQTEKPPRKKCVSYPSWESSSELPFEEFARAVSIGLFNYLEKTRSLGFTLSLSGGADSGCIASLVRLMVRLSIADIGKKGFLETFLFMPKMKTLFQQNIDPSEEDIVAAIFTTVYQGTKNSGDVTRNAAEKLSAAIGAKFFVLDINEVVEKYKEIVEVATGIQLNWEQHDVVLQNIQARSRAPSIWMFANLQNRILLATSNRSEASVGYATMDGDTAGGLSPIAGVDKPFVRAFLRWLEKDGLETESHGEITHFVIPALHYINEQQPTAELRPKEEKQTDEADLMPYEVLNQIETLLVKYKESPSEIFECLKVIYPEKEDDDLLFWLDRFLKLFTRNQWKRERYAPAFHLDGYSLDPKSWFRFPILNAGFKEELAELKARIEAEK